MGLISWVIVGAIAGLLARRIVPGVDPGRFIVTVILGGVDLVALDPVSDAEADVQDGSTSLTRQRFLDFLPGPRNSGGLGKSLAGVIPSDPERRDP